MTAGAAFDVAPALTRAEEVAAAAQLACLLEASAPKPGNVSPAAAFHDATYEDFLASAVAIGPALLRAGSQPLGRTVREAVEATRRLVPHNTNLGIVLLVAPLARAAIVGGGAPLRAALARELAHTTVADADEVYAAIRQAAPAGLGRVAAEDVAGRPSLPLRDVMCLAVERDTIAREYATDFATTFEIGAPAVRRARDDGLSWNDAVVETFLVLLAATPDSLIRRKLGMAAAAEVSRRAERVLAAGATRRPEGRLAIAELARSLADAEHGRNPGTTADLTAAAVLVHLLEQGRL